ncbi:hypothetical protein [Aestuariivirga litoralis]|uniref:hypothetical protein n=1 Tax=Aestuariivirga litoralis TaxID=2650924 RepID=UPI0018C5CFF1|nr:hypothetical protein [Aestuariivirga litoralis]MBG1233693.1 hypothetical protein [Aestuariivirga litoralis]
MDILFTRIKSWPNFGLNREDGPKERKEFRDTFTHGALRKAIRKAAPKLADIFEQLYERAIDYGAHPNIGGFTLNTRMDRSADRVDFLKIYLHGDRHELDFAIRSCAQIGIWNLGIFQIIYPEKFLILGIKDELEKLRDGL